MLEPDPNITRRVNSIETTGFKRILEEANSCASRRRKSLVFLLAQERKEIRCAVEQQRIAVYGCITRFLRRRAVGVRQHTSLVSFEDLVKSAVVFGAAQCQHLVSLPCPRF